MFFTKRGINDKNDKKFLSNLTLCELDQSTKIGVRILEVRILALFILDTVIGLYR